MKCLMKSKTVNNANIIGSLTVNGSVLRGFSDTNYLTVSSNFDVSSGRTWEMVYKVITGSDVTTGQTICGHTGSSNGDPIALVVNDSKFMISLCSSSSVYIKQDGFGTYTVLANTNYWLKFTFNGSKYVLSYSLNGVDYIQDIVVESTTSVYTSDLVIGRQQGGSSEFPWLGSIDLKDCYVNVSGKRLWSGVNTIKVPLALKLNKTVYLGVK